MLDGKMVIEKWSFEDLETKGKTKSGMNKAVEIVLKG